MAVLSHRDLLHKPNSNQSNKGMAPWGDNSEWVWDPRSGHRSHFLFLSLYIKSGQRVQSMALSLFIQSPPIGETLQRRQSTVSMWLNCKGGRSIISLLPPSPAKVWLWQKAELRVSVGQRPWAAGCPQRLGGPQHRQMGSWDRCTLTLGTGKGGWGRLGNVCP